MHEMTSQGEYLLETYIWSFNTHEYLDIIILMDLKKKNWLLYIFKTIDFPNLFGLSQAKQD